MMTAQKILPDLYSEDAQIFQLMLDSISDYCIFMLDSVGNVVSWNKGATYITGYCTGEMLHESFAKFFTDKDSAEKKLLEILQETSIECRYEEESWLRHKNGAQYWATIVISSIIHPVNRSLIGFSVVIRDISERKHIRDSLQQSEEKLRLMIESMSDYSILMLDPRGYIEEWSHGAEKIKGYKANEIIGRHFSCFYSQEDKEAGKPRIELEVATATGRFEDEGWRIKKNGSKFWANVIVSAVRDEKGTLKGFTKVTRDLTERKLAEEALRKSEQHLLLANKELEAFSYSVSHDLRAPLRAISGYSHILEDELGKNNTEVQKGLLHKIQTSVGRMGELINALLKLSRIGRQRLSMRHVNIETIVQNIVAEHREYYDPKHVEVVINNLPMCLGDSSLIKQVFENLISNSFKFTSKLAHPLIEISGYEENQKVVYIIKDNGVGFNMEYINNLFGVFQRLHQMDEFPGTGIGLSIVQRIIERHGGKIWAEGEINKGASFYFSLPCVGR